jgi:hypothetical protein
MKVKTLLNKMWKRNKSSSRLLYKVNYKPNLLNIKVDVMAKTYDEYTIETFNELQLDRYRTYSPYVF